MRDLVSYNSKHNYDNGEENRDGDSHNRSWNCGHEGPSDDLGVVALRGRQVRNFLTTLLLSQGAPMLLAGDELGRTQRGNNNSYCQDNEISWLDWGNTDRSLLDFVRKLSELRRAHPVLRRSKWFRGRTMGADSGYDIGWFRADGAAMQRGDWQAPANKAVGVLLRGDQSDRSELKAAQVLYVAFNAHHEHLPFAIPEELRHLQWSFAVDTAAGEVSEGDKARRMDGSSFTVLGHAMVVLLAPT